MAGSTTSIATNQITVYLTWDQREYLRRGAHRFQIPMSEYLRRVLDNQIHGEMIGATASVRVG